MWPVKSSGVGDGGVFNSSGCWNSGRVVVYGVMPGKRENQEESNTWGSFIIKILFNTF